MAQTRNKSPARKDGGKSASLSSNKKKKGVETTKKVMMEGIEKQQPKAQKDPSSQKKKVLPEEPPQPVSSDDDDDSKSNNAQNDDDDDEWKQDTPRQENDKKATSLLITTAKTSISTAESTSSSGEMSRLFAPYRTVGIVCSGRPFHLLPHQNSGSAMLCMPIGERFHILQCDRLQPVLVSQKVPGCFSRTKNVKKKQQSPQHIAHIVSDATLSISAVAHGTKYNPDHITLFSRTRPLQTIPVGTTRKQHKQKQNQASWKIVDLLHLGRMKVPMTGEKEGKDENAAIVGAILCYPHPNSSSSEDDDDHDAIDVVGDSSDEDSSSDEEDSTSSSSSDEENDQESSPDCLCQVVILLATRDTMKIHKRILLRSQPTFVPTVAVHPSTYVNKIVLGGSVSSRRNQKTEPATTLVSPALILLNIRSGKVIHEFSCITSSSSSSSSKYSHAKKNASTTVTALEQSPAVDTMAVGTDTGKVHLVNLKHDKTLFTLTHKPRDKTDDNGKAVRITSISFRTDGSAMNYGIAPMAVGRSDGAITIWDLNPPDDDSDDDDGGFLASKKSNKKQRTILTEMYQVHPRGGVSKLMYLPQEPLLVSIGKHSNAVLMHIFDNPDHSGRILRQRKGHTAAPSRIRYLHPGAAAGGGIMVNMSDGTDASACQILSSGGSDRTLRVFSTARTVLDKEYSQGRGLEKKAKKLAMDSAAELLLPPLTAMAMCEARSRDWGDLVTIHKEHAMAYVWSTKRGAQWGPVLRQKAWNVSAMKAPPPTSAHAVSVAMSACGNFALVGTRGGIVYKYNVQSGNSRGSYPRDAGQDDNNEGYKRKVTNPGDVKRTMKALEKKMKISNRASNLDRQDHDAVQEALVENRRLAKLKLACHTGSAVTGLAVDSTNKTMISVGADAKLILWNFATHAPHKKSPYKLPCPATMLFHVRDSDLAAIALEDFTTLLFDCTTLSIVRRFGGNDAGQARHSGPISDIQFSPDGRTLYTASLDGTVRVWDVPTNTCVDWLGFETPPTSLAVSPTGEFLATSHIGKLGLSVWSDRSFYHTVNVNGAKALLEPFRMDEPKPIAELWESSSNEDEHGEPVQSPQAVHDNERDETNSSVSELPAVAKQEGLVTLSNLPPAHWKNLFHLELIKERNKPKEAPKKPPSAPFFLQWRGGESMSPTPTAENAEDAPKDLPNEEDEWKAAWSDDDDNEEGGATLDEPMTREGDNQAQEDDSAINPSKKKRELEKPTESRIINSSIKKRKKITHHRSHLATVLHRCYSKPTDSQSRRFQDVTDYIATLGPSAIDVSLSSLCSGMHDLEEGLPLLRMACMWLIEACESRERYEAVNAYLHRFLHVHASVIAGIEESWQRSSDAKEEAASPAELEEKEKVDGERRELIQCLSQLRRAQQSALESLNGQLQNSLCLLRHFSRMV